MSQHDYVIENANGAAVRADINAVLQAIASLNSGASAPATTYANMLWYDTANSLLKKRTNANDAWDVIPTVDDVDLIISDAISALSPLTPSNTATLTNKRITDRVGTVASSATPTINTDNYDAYSITALAAAITSFTTNLSGTPTNFQKLMIRIKDDGTARAITWGSSFQDGVAALPTTTVLGKTLTVGLVWDSVDSKWTCEAVGSRA